MPRRRPASYLHTQADLDRAVRTLARRDPRLRDILAVTGMPPLRRRDAGFAGLARIVVGQMLSTASAEAIWERVRNAHDPFHHDTVRRTSALRLRRLGLSRAKAKTLLGIAKEIQAERLDLESLRTRSADEAHRILVALPGVGPWTADVYLLFCLGHSDAWPAGDVALQSAVQRGLTLRIGSHLIATRKSAFGGRLSRPRAVGAVREPPPLAIAQRLPSTHPNLPC